MKKDILEDGSLNSSNILISFFVFHCDSSGNNRGDAIIIKDAGRYGAKTKHFCPALINRNSSTC